MSLSVRAVSRPRRRLGLLVCVLVAALVAGAVPAAALLAPASTDLVRWSRVTGGLAELTRVLTAPGSPRVYVTQRKGLLRVVERRATPGAVARPALPHRRRR
jgi:hypothetical protein